SRVRLGRHSWKMALLVLLSRLGDVPLMSCSHTVERSVKALRVGLPRGSLVIPNGVDVTAIRQLAVGGREQPRGATVIAMVARMDESKDHPLLLRAFAKLLEQNP